MTVVQRGPKGGRFYISPSGNKIYADPPKENSSTKEAKPSVKSRPTLVQELSDRGITRSHPVELAKALKNTFQGKIKSIQEIENIYSTKDHSARVFALYVNDGRLAVNMLVMKKDFKLPESEQSSEAVSFDKSGKIDPRSISARVKREFYRDEKGNLVVYHDMLRVDKQGEGLGSEINKQSFRQYREIGVSKVTLHAAEIGRYAWARTGFNWDKDHADKNVKPSLTEYLVASGVSPELAERIVKRHAEKAWEVAGLRINGRHIGKEFLLDASSEPWDGEVDMSKWSDEGYTHLRFKLGI